jgi:hypothetical protein
MLVLEWANVFTACTHMVFSPRQLIHTALRLAHIPLNLLRRPAHGTPLIAATDMRASSLAAQKTHKQEEQRMCARIAALEARCTGLMAQMAQAGFNSAEVAGRCLESAELLAGRLQQLGDKANDAIGSAQRMYEEALQGTAVLRYGFCRA